MRICTLLMLSCLLLGCGTSADEISFDYTVSHYGALKNFMHENDLSAKVDLSKFKDHEHLYGLGALENLKGEILIWDGKAYMSFTENNTVKIDTSFNHKAGLFVYVEISTWKSFAIPEDVKDYHSLELFVAETAENHGIDVKTPFPFLLDGIFKTVDWHVINWPEGDSLHTHEKHKTSGPHDVLENASADVLGFYSDQHHAIFTHHSTNMHLHFKTKQDDLAGHVDDIRLDQASLLLPVIE